MFLCRRKVMIQSTWWWTFDKRISYGQAVRASYLQIVLSLKILLFIQREMYDIYITRIEIKLKEKAICYICTCICLRNKFLRSLRHFARGKIKFDILCCRIEGKLRYVVEPICWWPESICSTSLCHRFRHLSWSLAV